MPLQSLFVYVMFVAWTEHTKHANNKLQRTRRVDVVFIVVMLEEKVNLKKGENGREVLLF